MTAGHTTGQIATMDATIQQPAAPIAEPDHPSEQPDTPVPIPSAKTPQEFYAEITQRPDVRAILEELAQG